MILIKLGVLLALQLTPPISAKVHIQKKKGKKGKGKSKGSTKSSKSSKKSTKRSKSSRKGSKTSSKSSKKSKKSQIEKPPLPDYAFEVGKPKGFFHIEYNLLPHLNLETCHIDILHWDVIAKIYTANSSVIYRNLIKDDTIWIPIMLEHKINIVLNSEELIKLQKVVVEFNITPNKKKMCLSAKNEKAKMFYIKAEDVGTDKYVEAYETDPNIEKDNVTSISSFTKKTLTKEKSVNKSSRASSVLTVLYQFDEKFIHMRFLKILKRLDKGEQITYKEIIPPFLPPLPEKFEIDPDEEDARNYTWPKSKKSKGKKKKSKEKGKSKDKSKSKSKKSKSKSSKSSKSSKKSKAKSKTKIKKEAKIKISGESYLTDAAFCTYRLTENVDKINDVFIVFSTYDLTKTFILEAVNPLVVKLKSLRNLPIQCLIEEKFESIYFQYNIPDVARHVTKTFNLKDLNEKAEKKIKINEAHIYFNLPMPQFTSFLSTNRLIVELVGVYNNESQLKPALFGTQEGDLVPIPVCPNKIIPQRPKSLVLGRVCYDLSLLMHSMKELQLIEPLRHPQSDLVQDACSVYHNKRFIYPFLNPQVDCATKQNNFPSPLSADLLTDFETHLKVQVALANNINIQQEIKDISVVKYKRVLMILLSSEVAELILADVRKFNQEYLNFDVNFPNYDTYNEVLEDSDAIDPNSNLITGFWIVSDGTIIVYLEANHANYCFEMVINEVRLIDESFCRYHYNSTMIFYHRVYKNFFALGGLYKITLKSPLKTIFAKKEVHDSRFVPNLAHNCIKKLDVIRNMQMSKNIYQSGMLPTVNELLCFCIEFSAPPKYIDDDETE